MWALAIWDQRKRELFCSRDRFGIKPFYYYLDQTVFAFASEIKGVLPDWNYTTRSQRYDETQPVETFRELLTDSIRLRLRSDVPVGIALSGGIDSSSILALASSLMGPNPPKSFTAVFPGESYNEHEYARIASQAAGSELFCVDYQPGQFMEDLSQVIWSMDYPALEGTIAACVSQSGSVQPGLFAGVCAFESGASGRTGERTVRGPPDEPVALRFHKGNSAHVVEVRRRAQYGFLGGIASSVPGLPPGGVRIQFARALQVAWISVQRYLAGGNGGRDSRTDPAQDGQSRLSNTCRALDRGVHG
jgi:hypothetical protein